MKENLKTAFQAYFDCNATTPVLSSAAQAALNVMETLYGNPSSTHLVGLKAKDILESTRSLASRAIGCEASEIIFTSGATEGIQTAIFSALQHARASQQKTCKLLYGATEHKAVPMALKYWVKLLDLPYEIIEIPVDRRGLLNLEFIQQKLKETALLCTMAVNNEVGTIQDLAAIERILVESRSETLWLVDCVQALGKLKLNLSESRIDYAAFSGHKLYAPKGVGFLYVRNNAPFFPLIVGGGQEKGFRSGTENLPGVAALGAILKELLEGSGSSQFQGQEQLVSFRNQLAEELKQAFPKILFNSSFEVSVPTTLNFSVPGFKSGELLDIFDSAGLRLSAGSACSSASVKPSHVLDAMGFPEWRSASALRLSFGPCTSEQEVLLGCELIRESALALKNSCLLDTNIGVLASELKDGVIQFSGGHSNSWVIVDSESRSCIIVDPTETVGERIESLIRCQNLRVLAILDTHSHADHESVRPVLQRSLADKMDRSHFEYDSLGWAVGGTDSYRVRLDLPPWIEVPAILIKRSQAGDYVLARLESPGHTEDSVSYLLGLAKSGFLSKDQVDFVFSGDLILSGGLGRTNFLKSSSSAQYHSLQNLAACTSPQSVICPAHDYDTSFVTNLETEKRRNALLSSVLQPFLPIPIEAFVERKMLVDRDLIDQDEGLAEVVCGAVSSSPLTQDETILVTADYLKRMLFKQNPESWVIDVRESPEHFLSKNWEEWGFHQPPLNVPISRLVNFVREMLKSSNSERELLFICRSGRRSYQAARAFRRMGFRNAFSLKGGIALM